MATKKYENGKARVMPTPFGVRVDFDAPRRLAADDIKKALIAAVEAIPASKLKGFNNGRITMIV
jgi:hypothetical protein